jgi:hypothetical protein
VIDDNVGVIREITRKESTAAGQFLAFKVGRTLMGRLSHIRLSHIRHKKNKKKDKEESSFSANGFEADNFILGYASVHTYIEGFKIKLSLICTCSVAFTNHHFGIRPSIPTLNLPVNS